MSNKELISEKREIKNVTQIVIREHHEGELHIAFGRKEGLTIEAPADILKRINTEVDGSTLTIKTTGSIFEKIGDAFRTSLTRKVIKYYLTIRELKSLDIAGLMKVDVDPLKTKQLNVKFNGAGSVKLNSLDVNLLKVKLTNVGNIKLEGKVKEQIVLIRGSGNYDAPNLESQYSNIELKGVGAAKIWTTDELKVKLRGVGKISYYGSPRVKSDIAPVGSFVHLGVK